MKMLILSEKDVEKLLTIEMAFEANAEAYKAYSSGNIVQPPIVSIDFRQNDGDFDIKSGYMGLNEKIGVKILSGFRNNPEKYNLPVSVGTMTLLDGRTGCPLCVMNASLITYFRTSAAGAYAATLLARKDSHKMAIIGTGGLAIMHLIATEKYFPLTDVYVYGIHKEKRKMYIDEMSNKYPKIIFHDCDTAEEAVKDADIVATATSAREAIVKDSWIKPGTHINAFGSDMQGKQELDPSIFLHAKTVVDNINECVIRGEIQHCIRQEMVKKEEIYAEIGEIASGQKSGRTNDSEITVFDSTGMSLQDIATASRIYEKAMKLGVGTKVEL